MQSCCHTIKRPVHCTLKISIKFAGPGDMLALFRCLSCKYSFSPDLKQLAMMGGPGRVYHSGEVRLVITVIACNSNWRSSICKLCSASIWG